MKRDMDLARRILLAVESSDADPREWVELDFVAEYPKNVVAYHVYLLADAGLIEANKVYSFGPDGYDWLPKHLTSSGHDFLESARNEDIWNAGKQQLAKVGGASLTMLRHLLVHIAKQKLGLSD